MARALCGVGDNNPRATAIAKAKCEAARADLQGSKAY